MLARFYFLLSTAQRAMNRRVDAELPGALTAPQAGVLFLVSADGTLIGEIARGLGATASSVTELVDRMVVAGLVDRRSDATDRRAQRLMLTEEGQHVRLFAQAGLTRLNAELMNGFSIDELAIVARWLETVRDRFSGSAKALSPSSAPSVSERRNENGR